jgi:hypothetical protein
MGFQGEVECDLGTGGTKGMKTEWLLIQMANWQR